VADADPEGARRQPTGSPYDSHLRQRLTGTAPSGVFAASTLFQANPEPGSFLVCSALPVGKRDNGMERRLWGKQWYTRKSNKRSKNFFMILRKKQENHRL
jgi:hypothetical protein